MQHWKLILIDFSFIISQNGNLITVQFQLVERTQYGHDNDTYVKIIKSACTPVKEKSAIQTKKSSKFLPVI